jgi:hypothetical protein
VSGSDAAASGQIQSSRSGVADDCFVPRDVAELRIGPSRSSRPAGGFADDRNATAAATAAGDCFSRMRRRSLLNDCFALKE